MGRFTTSTGRIAPINVLANAPKAFLLAYRRKYWRRYPELPWIPFSAIRYLDSLIRDDWRVWEVGSGMSTIWMASRAAHITSIEADEKWVKRLGEIMAERGISNVDLRYEWHGHRMSAYDCDDQSIDLLYVDGGPRSECLINGFPKVKIGGYVYCDNWASTEFFDRAYDWVERSSSELVPIQTFEDYIPGGFNIGNGVLFRKAG